MRMPAYRNKRADCAVLATALLLAACGRVELSRADAATAMIQTTAVEDGGGMNLALMAERRHFAIYSAYRALAGESAGMYRSSGDGNVVQRELDAGVPACTAHALLD